MSLQSPAERQLIDELATHIAELPAPARIINLGANTSTVIEDYLVARGIRFTEDRADVIPCDVPAAPWKGRIFPDTPIENMTKVPSATYDIAFANFVLEHAPDPQRAAQEIARIVKSGGRCIFSVPNPRAPEFLVARATPHGFHETIRGGHAHDVHATHYVYKTVKNLERQFVAAGFTLVRHHRAANTYGYLHRFPLLGTVSRWYDGIVNALHLSPLMGASCFVFEKK